MITLITGSPGSGKTLYCVDKLLRPLVGTTVDSTNDDGETTTYNRTVFTNIPRLLLDHELVDADWLENLHVNRVTGCVVVFDEVQRVWPNRPSMSKKPAAVEYLETHRHDGIDIILMTQNPLLLDPAVRALVGRHLHIRRLGGLGAAVVYEWDSCSNALNYRAAFTKTPYKYNRAVFKLYHSADVHTKQTRRMPFVVWMLAFGVAGAASLWPDVIARVTGAAPREKPAVQQAEHQPTGSGGIVQAEDGTLLTADGSPLRVTDENPAPSIPGGGTGGVGTTENRPLTAEEYRETLVPRLPDYPHTAPRYDGLTSPVRAPYPAACIDSESKGCQCFNQHGVKMSVRKATCQNIVKNGLFLDFEPEPRKMQMQQSSMNSTGEPTAIIISPSGQ